MLTHHTFTPQLEPNSWTSSLDVESQRSQIATASKIGWLSSLQSLDFQYENVWPKFWKKIILIYQCRNNIVEENEHSNWNLFFFGGGGILFLVCKVLSDFSALYKSGFPATLEISVKTLKMSSQFSSHGIWEKHKKKSGKTQGICDSDPEGKGFRQFGVCTSCAMCPSWVHWLTG